LFVGPVFARELVTAPRSWRLYAVRAVYVAALFLLVCTTFLAFRFSQQRLTLGDYARYGAFLFQLLSRLQLVVLTFFAALAAASAVAHEKDRRTLELLLLTRLNNSELVLGKLLASILRVLMVLGAALPLFMMIALFGGVSAGQIGRVFAVTLATVLAAGSLGGLLALWREKTFQTLALTAMALGAWIAAGEVLATGAFGAPFQGQSGAWWAEALTPWRAVLAATRPQYGAAFSWDPARNSVEAFVLFGFAATVLMNAVGVWRVRAWNPSQAQRAMVVDEKEGTIFTRPEETAAPAQTVVPAKAAVPSRDVWDNPILWREMRTWAYGTRILLIRVAYVAMFAVAAVAAHRAVEAAVNGRRAEIVTPLALLSVLSLVLINAQAVTSITSERDARALDLLLVTDLTPKEIIFGKLGGALYNAKEMFLLPLALCLYLGWTGAIRGENLLFACVGLLALVTFVTMLGVHCGMTYGSSLAAITVSLGTVFFLFIGVWVSMQIMTAFRGDFYRQFPVFLLINLVGGLALYIALGMRNPSPAMFIATFFAPFATFYSITSFELGNMLAVFLTIVATYSFATLAMLVPALFEFDIATGRTTGGEGE
jgi:ABC-type transport system involved in multi-copper enzyme maturation permease subunit